MIVEKLWIRIFAAVFCMHSAYSLECLYFDKTAETGNVDWWLVYKLPGTDLSLALDSRKNHQGFLWQRFAIRQKKLNPLQHTMSHYYKQGVSGYGKISVVAYNSEPPNAERARAMRSTSKGIMMWSDEANAALIVHTIPTFPDLTFKEYVFPEEVIPVGVAALCVTIPAQRTAKWARQLQFEEPLIYFAKSPPRNRYFDSYEVRALLSQRPITFQPYKMSAKFRTAAGIRLVMLGKHSAVRADIFSKYLRQLARDSFRVWGTTGPTDNYYPSSCEGRHHAERLRGPMILSGIEIPTREDRTVWAVSRNPTEPYLWCLGNTGRHITSQNLASGLICIDHKYLFILFNDIAERANPERCQDSYVILGK